MTRHIFIFAITLALASTGAAGRGARFRIGKTVRVDNVGVKFRGFLDLRSSPLRALTAYPLRKGDGTRVEAYERRKLWLREQCLGRWRTAAGSVTLARPTLPPPDDLPVVYQHRGVALTTKPLFEAWRKTAAAADQLELDPEGWRRWLEAFTDAPLEEKPKRIKRDAPFGVVVHQFTPKDSSAGLWLYVVRRKRSKDAPLCLVYRLNPGIDRRRSERAVRQSLRSVEFYEPVEDADKKLAVHGVGGDNPDWTPEYAASRERVIANIRNFEDWWYLPTENFIVVSNESNRRTIRGITESLEACRLVFAEFHPIKAKPKAVSVCRVFAEKEQFLDYTGRDMAWATGFWAAHKKELVVAPVDWGSSSMRRRAMSEIIYHEGFHQYIHYAFGERPTSVWFNEGNATFFEGLEIDSDGDYEIKPTDRAKLAARLAKAGQLPVAPFLTMNLSSFQSGDLSANYAMVWAIVFFLRKGCRVMDRENDYGGILSRYQDAFSRTGNSSMATAIAWRGVDLKRFTKDITEFYQSPGKLRQAGREPAIPYREAP